MPYQQEGLSFGLDAFNLLLGYGGLLSFGHAMFLGTAGYVAAHTAKVWGLYMAGSRLGFERSFRFEYSEDGVERHVGRLVLHGEDLVQFSGPTRAAQVVALH